MRLKQTQGKTYDEICSSLYLYLSPSFGKECIFSSTLLSINENTSKIKASRHNKFQDWKAFLKKHHGAVTEISKVAEVCFDSSSSDTLYHSDKFSESSFAPNLNHYEHQKIWKNGIPDISEISTNTKD
jgi:hypothetical protein